MADAAVGSRVRPGLLVREFRTRVGLTQREVADLAGLSVASLRDLEQGRVTQPRAATLRRLAEAMGLSSRETDELLHTGAVGDRQRATHRVEVLGPLRFVSDDVAVELGSSAQRVLLGMLALSPNTPVSKDALIEVLWGADSPMRAVEMLQSHVSRLRRRLPSSGNDSAPAISTVAGGYQLTIGVDEHDLLTFRQLVLQARQRMRAGALLDAFSAFAAAVALWRDEPVADVPALHSHPTAVALVSEWKTVVVEYAELAAGLVKYDDVIPALRQVTATDPLHEPAHAALMIALAGSGQQGEAFKVFQTLRRRLAEDLGADPGPELMAAHQRVLRQEVTRAKYAAVSAHRQLPPDIADFSGRESELRALREGLPLSADGGTAVVIASIEGMGGVGKTRLAIHLAHQLLAAGQYADVQLYVDLLGHADRPPADPAAVLASFLRLLGVEGNQIPRDLEERAALYRDRLYGKNALVLLDNAADEEQVLPLLPASPSNLVLITSRRTLALDGAQALPLDVFTPAEAGELFEQVLGVDRVRADPAGARRVVELCGRLPMAVALAARRLRSRAAWGFGDLADRLEETSDRLSELAAGSRKLRAVLDLSYLALSGKEQRLFRLSGLHPCGDFTAESVAALTGLTPQQAGGLLDRLVDEHLVMVAPHDRYRLHDLLAEYARATVAIEEPEARRRAATAALLNYYLYTAFDAARLLQAQGWTPELTGAPPVHRTPFRTRAEADQWFEAERANLNAEISIATKQGLPTHAWQLALAMQGFLSLHGYVEDWRQTQQKALTAVLAAGDRLGVAVTRTYLGGAYLFHGRAEEACDHLYPALQAHREAGNSSLEITTLGYLAYACFRLGRFSEALRHTEQAAALCAEVDPYRESVMRDHAGTILVVLGRLEEALASYQHAVELAEAVHVVESAPLDNLGNVYRRLGRFSEALEYLERGLSVAKDMGLTPSEAYARQRLANLYRDMGRFDEAFAELEEALRLVRIAGSLVTESEVLVDLGATYSETGALDKAAHVLTQGLARAVERSERYQQARAHTWLARVYTNVGRDDEATEQQRLAAELFAELGVPAAE